ncbi:hypothetical protein Aut01nite_01470 [Actinoplanes utahensis]|nr:hypothetical protein Aut01nite_01470 [Actinoplanes utahensis]
MVFSPATYRRRGYDGDVVDAFLSAAHAEFARLQAENRTMRERLRPDGPSVDDLAERLERLTSELTASERRRRDLRAEPAHARAAPPATAPGEFVAIAQQFADSYVGDAAREAGALRNTARGTADRILSEAHLPASTIDSDARAGHHEAIGRLSGDRAAALVEIERLNEQVDVLHDALRVRMTREVPRIPPAPDAGQQP